MAALKRQEEEEEAPELLIASPVCAAFSSLQHPNYKEMTPKELETKLRAAVNRLDVALKMCEIQAKAGRLFVFGTPCSSTLLELVIRQTIV